MIRSVASLRIMCWIIWTNVLTRGPIEYTWQKLYLRGSYASVADVPLRCSSFGTFVITTAEYCAHLRTKRLCPADNTTLAPTPDKSRSMLPPSDVDAHPQGASPFGVMDMVGNVWQWTDEYLDDHTAGAIIRGGSHYQPQGSMWYFPQAYKNDQHGKLLMMAPGYDRSGVIGFRCVEDVE